MTRLGTRALDVFCRHCGEDAGRPCLAVVDGCVMDAGRYHRVRIGDAAAMTRNANREAKEKS